MSSWLHGVVFQIPARTPLNGTRRKSSKLTFYVHASAAAIVVKLQTAAWLEKKRRPDRARGYFASAV